jgi:hypothetical protein
MEHLDSQYQAVADLAGIPPTVLHRLKPDEMRVLACVAEHRDRIVAQPEIALHVFGKAGDLECRRIGNMLRSVRFAVCPYVTIAAAFTNYRGKLAVGVQWKPKETNDSDHTADEA